MPNWTMTSARRGRTGAVEVAVLDEVVERSGTSRRPRPGHLYRERSSRVTEVDVVGRRRGFLERGRILSARRSAAPASPRRLLRCRLLRCRLRRRLRGRAGGFCAVGFCVVALPCGNANAVDTVTRTRARARGGHTKAIRFLSEFGVRCTQGDRYGRSKLVGFRVVTKSPWHAPTAASGQLHRNISKDAGGRRDVACPRCPRPACRATRCTRGILMWARIAGAT